MPPGGHGTSETRPDWTLSKILGRAAGAGHRFTGRSIHHAQMVHPDHGRWTIRDRFTPYCGRSQLSCAAATTTGATLQMTRQVGSALLTTRQRACRRMPVPSIPVLVLLGIVLAANPAMATSEADLRAKATAVHARVLTIDTHIDIPPDFGTAAYDILRAKLPRQKVDLPGMERGGLDAAFFVVFVPQRDRNSPGYARAVADAFVKVAAIRRMTDTQHPDRIGLALTAADVRRLHREGRRVALMGMENGYALGRHPELLDTYYEYGVRYLGLLHNGHNDIGDSAVPSRRRGEPQAEHGGLSAFGRAVIARANALGIMVDISHASMPTALDAIRTSRAPVIASHSAVRGVRDHPRNLSDETLEALGRNGGMVSIVAFDSYLRAVPEEKQDALARLRAEFGLNDALDWERMSEAERDAYVAGRVRLDRTWPRASVGDLVDHIDYAVARIGIDHVGITSDFNGGGGIEGWNQVGESLNVTIELVRRGYREDEIAKLWGGNLLRVMEAVEAVASGSPGN